MLTAEENQRYTQVGPGTPMGSLMRRYWHPIAASSAFEGHGTRPVRLLGEDLVLFRDRSGTLGLIGNRCPHRRAGMVFGVPEANGLRCAYHGWLFDASGRCLEQPYEETEDPASTFKDRTPITSYPVQEMGGLIFAYLGPQPAPLLPRWDVYVMSGVRRDIGQAVLPCNWLQCMENSLDPIHVEWLHQVFSDYVLERLGRPDLKRRAFRDGVRDENPVRHEKIGFTVFEHGITKRRVMTGSSEDDEDWRIGHPIVFPNILRTLNAFQIRVPMDDTHTLHFWYTTYPPRDGIEISDADAIPCYAVPVPGLDAEGQPEWPLLDNNSGQDVAMWYTQGDVADRSGEHLGRSDQGVITYRNLLRENMEKVERGQDPMNVFRNPLDNECVWLPVERNSFRFGYRMPEGRAGQSGKYSPILRQAAVRAKGEDVLLEPVHTF